MNKQIFSLLGTIGASPYMPGAQRLNSQYAKIETLCEWGAHADCVAACSALFEQLMKSLYLGVTGETTQLPVILSDIAFWDVIGNKAFCDTAGMLQYACYRLTEEHEDGMDAAKAAKLAKSGLDAVIEHTARFLSRQGKKKCLDPAILKRDDVRERIRRFAETLRAKLDGAGCSDGVSMQPPFMNIALLGFPEGEADAWAGYAAMQLHRKGLLTSEEVGVLDAERVVDERVGLTNEYIRRASAGANGGALLIEHFEAFDMPCLGGNLLDRALKTTATAAGMYRGSLCIVLSGGGDSFERALRHAEKETECFPLLITPEGKT